MAKNLFPWVRNVFGASEPLRFMGKVQAGSTQAIKAGELCAYNETAGYWVPVNAAADVAYSLAISAEEQKAADVARFMQFFALREGDVWEFLLSAARQVLHGDALIISDSQKLAYDADGLAVAHVVGDGNYPSIGTTTLQVTKAEVMFRREVSFLYKNMVPMNLKKILNKTAAYTLTLEDCGALVTNTGASGAVAVTAPDAVVPVGWWVRLMCTAAQAMQFDPKPDTAAVVVKGGVQAAGKYASITDEGDFMEMTWNGTNWLCDLSISGADADIAIEA